MLDPLCRCACAILLLCALVSATPPNNLRSRMRSIGQNAHYGPNLRGASWHVRDKMTIGSPPVSAAPGPRALEDYLLPRTLTPISYDLYLVPYLESPPERNFTFDGQVTIRLEAVEATSAIILHARHLQVQDIEVVKVSDGSPVAVLDFSVLLDDRQFFTINLGAALQPGQRYDVTVAYTGVLNGQGVGFFRSAYQDEQGNPKWLSATQFEAAYARWAFPCFDQPDLKATFTLHIAREPGFSALANMPVRAEGDPVAGLPGWQWVHFEQSVKMSTYLVAFSTNQFASLSSAADPRYKVWARPDAIQSGQYSSEISPELVNFYEAFTGVTYSLPKMDQIGMVDFFSGAMENWGLITYVEFALLLDPAVSTTADKQLVAQIVSHEIAHQWFGDLVSPKWWSDIWLNEGFATYFEYHGTAAIGADWQLEEQFVVDMMHSAFRADVDSHPIRVINVDSPNAIMSIFDSISYNKGGCLVRFMLNLLGEAKFKVGINNYLTALSYSAAEQDDLFQYLAAQNPPLPNGVTFKQLMDTWTLQAGFPLVTVTRNYGQQSATVTQTRFGGGGAEQWVVPLTFTSADSPNFSQQSPRAWLIPGQPQLTLFAGVPASQDWIIFNLKQTGYYRVNYDLTNWALIASFLGTPGNAASVDPLNRAQLMDDAATFARAGLLGWPTALGTTAYLQHESQLVPWTVATYVLEDVRDRVYQTQEGVALFQDYMQRKMRLVYGSVSGFSASPSDAHSLLLTRHLVTRWACNVEDAVCNDDGRALFLEWRSTAEPDVDNPVPLDLRTPAYCAGQRRGGQADFDFLLARYVNSGDGDEQGRLLAALGCSPDLALLQTYLEMSLSTSVVRPGDALSVLMAVYSHPAGLELALDFLIDNWRTLDPLYGNIGYGFIAISEKLNTQEHVDKIRQFRSENSGELGASAVALVSASLQVVESNLAWSVANLDDVMDFFRSN